MGVSQHARTQLNKTIQSAFGREKINYLQYKIWYTTKRSRSENEHVQ